MKLILILLILIQCFIISSCFDTTISNNGVGGKKNKISKNLFKKFGKDLKTNFTNKDIIKLWVFFNSKDYYIETKQNTTTNTANNTDEFKKYKEISKITGVNNESIKRRNKRSTNKKKPIFDETDLPVSTNYIDLLLKDCNNILDNGLMISLIKKSNWLNSISISVKNNNNQNTIEPLIKCISNKTFVDSIDLVSKYLNPNQLNSDSSSYPNTDKVHNTNANKEAVNQLNKLIGHVKLLSTTATKTLDQSFYGESYIAAKLVNIDKIQNYGLDGTGIKIMVMDTGFYTDHIAFKHLKIIGQYNFIDNTNIVQEPIQSDRDVRFSQNFHGTATLSALGGFIPGQIVGPAYNASYLLAKTEIVEGEDTVVEEDNWVAALEWGERLGVSVVSSSLSYQLYNYPEMNGQNSHLTKAANLASSKGIVVVNSMGNKDYSIFGAPSDGTSVISVGAVDKLGKFAPFSSIGPTADGRVKPDVMGLGVSYYVAFSNSSTGFSYVDGTSFACPLVASGIALLMQAHPDWNPQQIYQAVLGSASKYSNPDPYMGFGIFNALSAYNYRPYVGDCFSTGCSGRGLCCGDGQCQCAPAFYGQQCQYKRVECGYRCVYDFREKCQSNNIGPSFLCIDHNDTSVNSILNQDPFSILFCKQSIISTIKPTSTPSNGGLGIRIVINL